VHSAYVSIKSLMDTSILGLPQRINMPWLDAYKAGTEEPADRQFAGEKSADAVAACDGLCAD
ncbi:hypothetical protein, partial [Roseateles puraquae]